MKTILHVSKYYYPDLGGIETVAMYLAEGLSEYQNVVICFANDNKYHEDEVHGVKIYRVPVNFSFMSQDVAFSYYKILRQLTKQYQPAFCHVHCPNPFVYPLVCACVEKTTKVVLHWHSDILSKGLMYPIIRPFENAILKRADIIVSTSPNYIPFSKPLNKYPQKIRVAQNGLITDNFVLQPGDDEKIALLKEKYQGKKIIFFCGRHIPYKGIDNLIKADTFIHGDCVILIGGSGPIDDELKAIPCSERVYFLGRLPDDDLRQYLHAADIFAFPSNTKAEAFGIALAEAMYCHCAPVCFTIQGSGVNWVSIKEETGLEVPLNDVKAFASGIDKLINNNELLKKYSDAAHQRVTQYFTKKEAIEAMRKIYKELDE
ncbi:MAG: glycosyltransferase [Bacteroidales bacterium]|nr:glycosyltransferase [Bacteroidales bacterium]